MFDATARVLLGPLTPVELATARYVPAGLIALAALAGVTIDEDFVRRHLIAESGA